MEREAFLLAGATPQTRILEIGPSHRPVAPRAAGWNSRVLDHAPAAALRAKYAALGTPTDAIEEVDFVWSAGALHEAVPPPPPGGFDLLIASHVIEHVPDLLGFFRSASRLAAPDGRLALAVPDKRYCFDAFRPASHAGMALERHRRGAARHSLAERWAWQAYSVSAAFPAEGFATAWAPGPLDRFRLNHDLATCWAELQAYREDGAYEDVHGWVFTPASFRLLVLELAAIGQIDWTIEALRPAGGEFLVRLARRPEQPAPTDVDQRRLALLREMLDELGEQAARAAGATLAPPAPAEPPPPPAPPGVWDGFAAALRAIPGARILGIRVGTPGAGLNRDAFPGAHCQDHVIDDAPDSDVDAAFAALAALPGAGGFDAVILRSCLEHLANPFRGALLLPRLLAPGGLLFIQSHQSFPLKAAPRDYFRFSADGLRALFPPGCGLAVLEAGHEFPAEIRSRLEIGRPAFLNACLAGIRVATPQEDGGADEAARLAARRSLAAGLALHRAGRLAEAARAYRQALASDAANDDSWHLLGLTAHAAGRLTEALALVDGAIARHAKPRYLANRGMILAALGRAGEAEAACRAALAGEPAHVEAWNTLGIALLALGRAEQALAAHDQALALRPDYAEAMLNRASALAALERVAPATAAFRAARALLPPPAGPRRLLYVHSGPQLPGVTYRCTRMAAAAAAAGWQARVLPLAALADADLAGLSALVFWRVGLGPRAARAIALARATGARIGLDLDDLVHDPALARPEVIDGIRSSGFDPADVRGHFAAVLRLLEQCDFLTCTTEELAAALRPSGLPVTVLPNGFDAAFRAAAEAARATPPADGLCRIGYAGGTTTHQRDIAVAADAIAAVLDRFPATRLVLFRDPGAGSPLVRIEELPALARRAARIEWRDFVPLEALPRELARFDINIAPLETGNPFVEAKSELKYFEAALAGVPTIASPTGPFRRAIADGVTGLLAADGTAWQAGLAALVGDPALRRRLGEAARADALARFGPDRAATRLAALLQALPPPAPPGG